MDQSNDKPLIINVSNNTDVQQNYNDRIFLFGIDLTNISKKLLFVIGTVGVLVFYIIYGFLQERIFLIPGFKHYGWYLTWIQFLIYTVFSYIESLLLGIKFKKVPFQIYLIIGILTVSTIGFSNFSVGYLNYPTQVIFKCCKLLPTMVGGIIIQKIHYTKLDYVSVITVIVGLIWFILVDSQVHPNFNLYGIFLISIALCADGLIGNIQEKVMKAYILTATEVVFYSYSIGTLIITSVLIVTNQLIPAMKVCATNPYSTYGMFILFSASGYFGVNFILLLVKHFGALPAVTVSTCRKAVTIIISFIFFEKPFSIMYVYSGTLIVFGLYLSIYAKNRNKWESKLLCFIQNIGIKLGICKQVHSNVLPI